MKRVLSSLFLLPFIGAYSLLASAQEDTSLSGSAQEEMADKFCEFCNDSHQNFTNIKNKSRFEEILYDDYYSLESKFEKILYDKYYSLVTTYAPLPKTEQEKKKNMMELERLFKEDGRALGRSGMDLFYARDSLKFLQKMLDCYKEKNMGGTDPVVKRAEDLIAVYGEYVEYFDNIDKMAEKIAKDEYISN